MENDGNDRNQENTEERTESPEEREIRLTTRTHLTPPSMNKNTLRMTDE